MEKQQYNANGVILSPVDVRDYKIAKTAIPTSFAKSFELPLTKVKNQFYVGACPAFAMSNVMEYHNEKQGTDCGQMSTGGIYGNRRHSDYKESGMCVRDMLSGALHEGNCPMNSMPDNVEVPEAIEKFEAYYTEHPDEFSPYRISAYFKADTVAEIKTALMNYGPVLFVIPWYNDIEVTRGKMSSATKDTADCGYHCMFIYGWDEDGWKIQNSWGLGWGRKGRAVMPYDFGIREAWGVVDDIVEGGDLKHPWTTWLGNLAAKCINALYAFITWIKK